MKILAQKMIVMQMMRIKIGMMRMEMMKKKTTKMNTDVMQMMRMKIGMMTMEMIKKKQQR